MADHANECGDNAPIKAPCGPIRLKILQVVEATHAGVGRHVADLCTALLMRGHEVHLAYSPVRIEERFAREIRALPNLHSYPLLVTRAPSLSDIGAILSLRRYIRINGPFDVVHGHSSKGGAIARISAAALCSARVYTSHAFGTLDPDLPRSERMLYSAVERALGRSLTSAFIGVASEEAREARRLGIALERTHVVPNGILIPATPDRSVMRAKHKLEEAHVCLMWVGRMVPQKAPDRFVRLFSRLLKQAPEVRGLMIGSGPLEGRVRDLIRDLGVADRLQLLQDQHASLSMPAADIFVLTSRYEGMAYVLLEAQSAGLPIVGFEVGGLSTVVENGVTGFIVAQGDETGFCDALCSLVSEPTFRRQVGDAARRRSERFRLDDMVNRIEAIYRRLSAGLPS